MLSDKTMKAVDKMPLEGQFVAVWKYDEKLWSATFLWDGYYLYEYVQTRMDDEGSYEEGFQPSLDTEFLEKYNAVYFVPV